MRLSKLSAALPVVAAILIVVYYWRFTHVSLRTSFGHDDLMNLFFAWRDPIPEILKANLFFRSVVLRPFGTLFYATFFNLFGFDGLPFRVFCYAVLWCNVLLTYVFVRRLTFSREIGLFAVLLHCYQANYFPMYYGSGYCYDVFAFFFYYAAFILVLRARQAGRFLNVCESIAVAILFACAVNSKEAATSLPVTLLIYELLYNPPKSLSWIWREARAVVVTGCIGLIYLWARFTGPNNLLAHPAYSPVFRLERYLDSVAHYLNELTSQSFWTPEYAVILLGSMALIAVVSRRRELCFAWLLIVIGAAPIAFVPPRGVAAYYIPLVGYAIFFGAILVRFREFLVRGRSPVPILASQILLFSLVFGLNWRWQIRHQRRFPDYWRDLALMNATAADFRRHPGWFRPGSLMLIVSDPFPENEWATAFIALLIGNDRSIVVHRLGKIDPPPTQADIARYATVIGYENGRYVELKEFRLP